MTNAEIIARRTAGQSTAEIAKATGTTPGVVRSWFRLAKLPTRVKVVTWNDQRRLVEVWLT